MLVEFILGIYVGFFNWIGSIFVVPEPVFILLRTTVGWLKQLFDMMPKHPLLPITEMGGWQSTTCTPISVPMIAGSTVAIDWCGEDINWAPYQVLINLGIGIAALLSCFRIVTGVFK